MKCLDSRWRTVCLLGSCVALVLGEALAAPAADATNGVFGRGSYVGSDHWFSSFTQTVLIQAATRGLERLEKKADGAKDLVPPAPCEKDTVWVGPIPDGCWRPPVIGTGYQAPAPDGGYRPPVSDGDYRSPQSDGDFKRPGSAGVPSRIQGSESAPPGTLTTRDPGRGRSQPKAEEASCRGAALNGHRLVLERDIAGAITSYRKAVTLAGKKDSGVEDDVLLALGAALLAERQLCEAAGVLERAMKRSPSSLTHLLYGIALLYKGELREARSELAKCSPEKTGVISSLLLGLTADAMGDRKAALKAYKRYLEEVKSPEVEKRCEELRAPALRRPQKDAPVAAPPGGRTAAGPEAAGSWRIQSSRLFYDQGGGGALGGNVFRPLELSADGTWSFGASQGRWSVDPVTPEDWKRWRVEPYGPRRKVTLSGWNEGTTSGPIEESGVGIDYLWVIYRTGPPAVDAPGDVHMKLSRR